MGKGAAPGVEGKSPLQPKTMLRGLTRKMTFEQELKWSLVSTKRKTVRIFCFCLESGVPKVTVWFDSTFAHLQP